jgi:anti-sigma regulatory factor (Ser/Thr protein kinase)
VHLEASIPVSVEAAALARQELDDWFSASVGKEIADRLRLATSEVVTNAVRHGHLAREDALRLFVDVDGEAVRSRSSRRQLRALPRS